jgi:hypothetical protein
MKKKPLQVSIRVSKPSVIELTVGDKVQLDRLIASPDGYLAERHGKLLNPGVRTIALDQGFYFLKTLSEANLKVVHGGVEAEQATNPKSGFPRQSIPLTGVTPPAPDARGNEPDGEAPRFTID